MVNSYSKSVVYDSALAFAKKHYENFPVISFLIPKALQNDVAAIYWFARTADDIADEGVYSATERLDLLEDFEKRFINTLKQNFASPFDEALFRTIKNRGLTPQLFLDLLKAFKQDAVKKRYVSYQELLEYCSNSANPVGRLMLELFNVKNEAAVHYSDLICTALQITNFLQDTAIDFKKGRIYLPQEELAYYGVEEIDLSGKNAGEPLKQLIKFNVERTSNLFHQGRNLLPLLKGRLRLEIKWTIAGGEEILNKIRKIDYNVLRIRPSLSKKDFIGLFIRSLL